MPADPRGDSGPSAAQATVRSVLNRNRDGLPHDAIVRECRTVGYTAEEAVKAIEQLSLKGFIYLSSGLYRLTTTQR